MYFFIGNSVSEIDERNYYVEFIDDLEDFIYEINKNVNFDMSKLYGIYPYDDIVIPKKDLPKIIEICDYILSNNLLENYKYKDEGIESIEGLKELSKDAIKQNSNLVSLGD